ncbi:MAG: hypothetical protein ACOYIR_03850 [Christensenellales bacterium]
MSNKFDIESAKESKLPLRFIENRNREDGQALFTACCNGKKLLFEKDRIAIFKRGAQQSESERAACPRVALRFVGARENAPAGFLLNDVQLPRQNGESNQDCCETVPAYGMLKYSDVWDGVDLELSACDFGLKMNWVLKTPDVVHRIRLCWEGATALEIDQDGSLLIHHAQGTLRDAAPEAWQVLHAELVPIGCSYKLAGGTEFLFELSCDCDKNSPIVIDPLLH